MPKDDNKGLTLKFAGDWAFAALRPSAGTRPLDLMHACRKSARLATIIAILMIAGAVIGMVYSRKGRFVASFPIPQQSMGRSIAPIN